MQLPCFNEYRELFYDLNRKKRVPENIRELLTPLLRPRSKDPWVWTEGQDKFNLKCSIHYNRDNKPRIYIFKESNLGRARDLVLMQYFYGRKL